jgi:hypothetical protein
MLIPSQFADTPVYDLLAAAAAGHIGVDARLVQAIIARGPSAAADILRFAREAGETSRLDLEPLLVDLLRHLQAPGALDFYLERIVRNPGEVSDELSEAIVSHGPAAVEPLIRLYREVGEEEGHEIAFLLATLRVRDPRVLEILTERLEYDAGDAAFCLGIYGDPAARPVLEQLLAQIPADEPEFRHQIQQSISQLTAEPAPFIPEPFDILEHYTHEEPPLFDLMSDEERLEMLNSELAEYRAEAAASFFNDELSTEVRDRLFDVARADSDPRVRARCWESLAAAVTENAEIRAAMLAVVSNENAPEEERGGALVGLYPVLGDKEIQPHAVALYDRGGPARVKALEAMSRSLERDYAPYFPKHLDDPDPAIQEQAILGVGYLNIVASAGKLREFFNHPERRPDALFAYALCVPSELSRGRVPGLFRKIEKDAGGLDDSEVEIVETALDQRLMMRGLEPYFHRAHESED